MNGGKEAAFYLKADLQTKEAAMAAIRELKASGFNTNDLDVFSDRPVEFPPGVLDRPSHMSLFVVLGAMTFSCLIVGFVYYTQHDYPLITGGMPIFSFWSTGVVFYEITMLGAVLTTFSRFLWESGLLRRNRRIPVPAVAPGTICLRVHCRQEQLENAGQSLTRAGALKVERLAESA
ncbi:MAG TPA: quinol:electron acceptor oxidoreductase subunit ActD [Bryobacteraceae bacterium]|nr:quinol:electron acceptor oxidoreductase subunit ActD [Bryobacteraceae bacterium]